MSRPPVTIYLDSSDYSRLSDVRGDAVWQEVCTGTLTRAIDAGLIEIRFSASMVAEISPLTIRSAEDGMRRLRMLSSLARGHALRFVGDLISAELTGIGLDPITSDGGWTPALDLTDNVRELKGKILESGLALGRNARRTFFTNDKRHLKNAEAVVSTDAMRKLIDEKYPVVASAIPRLVAYLEGNDSAQHVATEMLRGFSDLDEYAKMFLSNFEDAEKLSRWVRGQGESHLRRVFEMRPKSLNAYQSMSRAEFERVVSESIERVLIDTANTLQAQKRLTTKFEAPPFTSVAEIEARAPTVFSLFSCAAEVMRNQAVPEKAPMRPEKSDVGDIYHAAYLPHVDWFRCDSRMRPCIAPIAARFNTRLFDKLDALIEQVDGLAAP